MLYAVAWPGLPAATAEALEAVRRRHDPRAAALLPAHLTLVFGLPGHLEQELRARLAALAAGATPLTVTFERLAWWATGGRRLLHLPVAAGSATLRDWYETLHGGSLARLRRVELEMEPHLTLVENVTGEGAAAADAGAAQLALPLTGRVDTLELLRREPGRLLSLGRFVLSGQRFTPAPNQ